MVMKDVSEHLLESLKEFQAFARKRVADPELAADVVQESLLKALKSGSTLRKNESSKAWFYRILRRTIIDLYRRGDVRDRALEQLAEQIDGPPSVEETKIVCRCIGKLLPTLKPDYADLLSRVDLDDQDADSVSSALGLTRSNLNVRLHRARKQLRTRLEETCRTCAAHGCLDCSCDEKKERSL